MRRKNGEHRNHEGRVLTTDGIAELIKAGRVIHLPVVQPVQYEGSGTPLPLDPYLLGLLIGDGGMTQAVSFFSADPELHAAVQAALPEGDILRPAADDPRNAYLRGGRRLPRSVHSVSRGTAARTSSSRSLTSGRAPRTGSHCSVA